MTGWLVPILNLLGMGAGSPSAPVLPVADFIGTPTSGRVPLSVTFTDLSTGTPTSWLWDFGDGETSTEENPAHVYAVVGVYSPSLTATNASGSDTLTRIDYITVTAVPAHTCSWTPPAPVAGNFSPAGAAVGSWTVPSPSTGDWTAPPVNC